MALHREATVLQAMPSPAADRYVAHGTRDGVTWLLLRWRDAETLWEHTSYIRAHPHDHHARQRFVADLVAMAESVARLSAAGYLHGDLQPQHFLVRSDVSPVGRIEVIDLEGAVRTDGGPTGYRGGLVHYVSPETAARMLRHEDDIPLSPASEVYSLAAVAFFLYCGRTPVWYGATPDDDALAGTSRDEKLRAVAAGRIRDFRSAGAADFSALESVLRRCLATDPRRRPHDATALADALRQIDGGETEVT